MANIFDALPAPQAAPAAAGGLPADALAQVGNIKRMLAGAQGGTPAVMQMLAQSDPRFAALGALGQGGGSAEQMARQLCQQRGIDADALLSQVNGA